MINKFITIIMALNIVVLLVLGYFWFWPAPLPIIYNEPFPLDKTEVKRGEEISYLIHLDKRANYSAKLNRNIICKDGNLVTLAPQDSHIPNGESWVWVTVTVPMKTSPSTCYLEMNNSYFINPLRTETMTMRTQDFKVI